MVLKENYSHHGSGCRLRHPVFLWFPAFWLMAGGLVVFLSEPQADEDTGQLGDHQDQPWEGMMGIPGIGGLTGRVAGGGVGRWCFGGLGFPDVGVDEVEAFDLCFVVGDFGFTDGVGDWLAVGGIGGQLEVVLPVVLCGYLSLDDGFAVGVHVYDDALGLVCLGVVPVVPGLGPLDFQGFGGVGGFCVVVGELEALGGCSVFLQGFLGFEGAGFFGHGDAQGVDGLVVGPPGGAAVLLGDGIGVVSGLGKGDFAQFDGACAVEGEPLFPVAAAFGHGGAGGAFEQELEGALGWVFAGGDFFNDGWVDGHGWAVGIFEVVAVVGCLEVFQWDFFDGILDFLAVGRIFGRNEAVLPLVVFVGPDGLFGYGLAAFFQPDGDGFGQDFWAG